MKITFNAWAADEIIQAYIKFISQRNAKETYITYMSDKFGLKETLEGRITLDDKRLKDLPKKIQFEDTRHELELCQKDWKIKFRLKLSWDPENDRDSVELELDESLRKEVYTKFKEFEPKKSS